MQFLPVKTIHYGDIFQMWPHSRRILEASFELSTACTETQRPFLKGSNSPQRTPTVRRACPPKRGDLFSGPESGGRRMEERPFGPPLARDA